PGRADQHDRLALQAEGGRAEREDPPPAAGVLQRHGVLLAPDHRAAELAGRVLDDQPALGGHPRKLALPRAPPSLREHVWAVLLAPHGSSSSPVMGAAPPERTVLSGRPVMPGATRAESDGPVARKRYFYVSFWAVTGSHDARERLLAA